MPAELEPTSRYTIISVDGHAGAELREYKPYLASRWHDEFDAWADAYVNPYADLLAPTAYRSWDSERRLKETESQGVVAEVFVSRTRSRRFFAQGNLTALEPTSLDYERRWAGLPSAQPFGWPTSARPRRDDARWLAQLFLNGRRRSARRGSLGQGASRRVRRDLVAERPAEFRSAAIVGPVPTNRSGICAKSSTWC